MGRSPIKSPRPVPRLIPSVVNADPAVLARESTSHADAILRQSDQVATAMTAATTAATTANAARGAVFKNAQIDFGAKGDGVTDDTAAIQAAIKATAGVVLWFPRGLYKVTSTLFITTTCHRISGDFAGRFIDGGTEIQYFGTGPCIQIGTDNGNPWDANDYDGPQDQVFENINISHGAPDTVLVSSAGTGSYKAGAYGIWDWRGGGIVLDHVGLERFEANFVGIQSDINSFSVLVSLYSKYGLYLGPRSDQCSIRELNSFFCDRALTIDRATHPRLSDSQIIGCGTATAPAIEIRRGSSSVEISRCWFEHLQGYAGADQICFISAGEVNGYGFGGSIVSPGGTPTTDSVNGLSIDHAFIATTTSGSAHHTKYLATVGKVKEMTVAYPTVPAGGSLANLDGVVVVPATQAPTSSDTQIDVRTVDLDPFSLLFSNLGAGSPAVQVYSGPWTQSSTVMAFAAAVNYLQTLQFTGELSTTIGVNQNDFNPGGLSIMSVLMITATAPVNITGLATGASGRLLWVYNNGPSNVTLTHQDPASAAGNRFVGRGGANTTLTPNTGAQLYYSPSQTRWFVMTDTL